MFTSEQIAKALNSKIFKKQLLKTLTKSIQQIDGKKTKTRKNTSPKKVTVKTPKKQLQKLCKDNKIPCAGLSIMNICKKIIDTKINTGLRGPKPKNDILKKAISIMKTKFPDDISNVHQMNRETLSKTLIKIAKML